MFRRSTLVAAVSALLLSLGAVSATAAPSDPFSGPWKSIDADGSNQKLAFSGKGDVRRVQLFDDDATQACTEGGPARLAGTGEISADGSTIHLTIETLRCMRSQPNPALELPVGLDFVHDADADTLTDSFGVVWHRFG